MESVWTLYITYVLLLPFRDERQRESEKKQTLQITLTFSQRNMMPMRCNQIINKHLSISEKELFDFTFYLYMHGIMSKYQHIEIMRWLN